MVRANSLQPSSLTKWSILKLLDTNESSCPRHYRTKCMVLANEKVQIQHRDMIMVANVALWPDPEVRFNLTKG